MEIIDGHHGVADMTDGFLVIWSMCTVADRWILPADCHAAAYAVLRQHIVGEEGETEFQPRAVLISRAFQPYREEGEYRPCVGRKVLRKREQLFQARAAQLRAERERVGWSQPIGPRGVEQLVYLSYRYPAGLAGYANEGEALDKALALVMEEKRGGEKLWNSLEWARVYWFLGREPRMALIAEAEEEGMELKLDLQFAQRMDALSEVEPAELSANGRKACRVFMVYEHLLGDNEMVLLIQD